MEQRLERHWLLQTEGEGLCAVQAVRACQDLWRGKATFRSMKDELESRRVWHRVEERVRAHVPWRRWRSLGSAAEAQADGLEAAELVVRVGSAAGGFHSPRGSGRMSVSRRTARGGEALPR